LFTVNVNPDRVVVPAGTDPAMLIELLVLAVPPHTRLRFAVVHVLLDPGYSRGNPETSDALTEMPFISVGAAVMQDHCVGQLAVP
jgi:hypothetical protein